MKTFKDLQVGEFFEFESELWTKTSDTDRWNANRSQYDQPGQFDDDEYVMALLS